MTTTETNVRGDVATGWERVADVLRFSLDNGQEIGAAVAVYQDGVPVVDIWGGVADARSGRTWQHETLACVFSASKGLAAICAHMLVQRGQLDLDAPVARYWPEFAGGGKADLLVRWLLTHQAGLPFVDQDMTLDDLGADGGIVRALEAQTPYWEPGTAYGYHAVTFGMLVGELVHRVSGKTLTQFLHHEVVAPLGLNLVLGLPEDASVDLARMGLNPPPPDFVAQHGEWVLELVERHRRAISLGGALPHALVTGEEGDFNDRRVLALELGGSNVVSDAKSLARAYAATVSEVDGVRLLTDETAAACSPIRTAGTPPFGLPAELVATAPPGGFGLGFMYGEMVGPSSFGHPGAGGAIGFADLDARLSFGYVTNKMGGEGDDRAARLIGAVKDILADR